MVIDTHTNIHTERLRCTVAVEKLALPKNVIINLFLEKQIFAILHVYTNLLLYTSLKGLAVARVRKPVPVFHFFPYGNPHPYLIASSTGNHGSSRTQFSIRPVWEIITDPLIVINPYLYLLGVRETLSF